MKYSIIFLLMTNLCFAETKITSTELSQPFQINASTSQAYALTIDSNSNTSDGYIVSVTTNGGLSANYSDIGYKIIASSQLLARGNSITISGFNIKRGQKCRLYFDVGNVSGSEAYVRIYLNGDTTLTNYWTQEGAFYGTNYGALRSNAPHIGYAGNLFNSEGYCDLSWAKKTGYYTWFCQSRRDDTNSITGLLYIGTTSQEKSSPISSITIMLSNSGNFEAGSYLELMCIGDWR